MTIHRAGSLGHWNYFLALEDDLERLSRYVDLSGNDDTYSMEIARLLLSACAEIDVVLKQLSQRYVNGSTASKIPSYFSDVIPHCPKFITFQVQIPRYGVHFQPWLNWTSAQSPAWWSDHNKVKHQRDQNFPSASLRNCLNALGGLFVAVLHLYEQEAQAGGTLHMPRLYHVGAGYSAGASLTPLGNTLKCSVR